MCIHPKVQLFAVMDKRCPDCVVQAEKIVLKAKYNFEKFRLESFQLWPVSYINPRELARNGFYFTGKADIVRCNFCDVMVYGWEAEDSVFIEHSRYSGSCPFLTGHADRNIPLATLNTPEPSPISTHNSSPAVSRPDTPEPGPSRDHRRPDRGYDVPPNMDRFSRPQPERIRWIPKFFS